MKPTSSILTRITQNYGGKTNIALCITYIVLGILIYIGYTYHLYDFPYYQHQYTAYCRSKFVNVYMSKHLSFACTGVVILVG